MKEYLQICQKLRAHNWTTEWDVESQSQYAYSDTGQWAGYDSLKSVTLKVREIYHLLKSIHDSDTLKF